MSQYIHTHKQVKQLINLYDNFIFDCDGVIYKGDQMVEGSRQWI